jgi:flagellin-like protein
MFMSQQDRGVTPVISTILMVAIVIILAATVSVYFLGVTEDINEPAPNVADTAGEFEVADGTAGNKQVVKITHIAGEDVAVEKIEIVVRASGPTLDTEARLVDLPTDSFFSTAIDSSNIQGDESLIDESSSAPNQVIVPADPNTWKSGDTIRFRIATSGADFREGETPDADTLEVIIIHTPSNSIISEHAFTP